MPSKKVWKGVIKFCLRMENIGFTENPLNNKVDAKWIMV
jgi:hypothetical protein